MMNREETARLVNLIVSTWPAGVKGHVWTDTLGELEHTVAHDAYLQLRVDADRPPSVARFVAVYRSTRVTTASVDEPPTVCQLCEGTGWVETEPIYETVNGEPHPFSQVTPCVCSTGERMRPVHARIGDTNRQR